MFVALWILVVVMVGYTLWKVIGHEVSASRARRAAVEVQEFVDFVVREVSVGARPAEAISRAAEHTDSEKLRKFFGLVSTAIELGEQPRADLAELWPKCAPYPDSWAESDLAEAQDQLRQPRRMGTQVKVPKPEEKPAPAAEHVQRFLWLWATSYRRGVSLGKLAEAQVQDLDARLARMSEASSAMAGARLTVTLLVALPIGAIALGESSGLHTMSFLTCNVLGALLSICGVFLMCAGTLWAESMAITVLGGVGVRAGPSGAGHSALEYAQALDVASAGLDSGLALAEAWELGVSALTDDTLVNQSLTLLQLGAGSQGWQVLKRHSMLSSIARQAEQQTRAGTTLARSMAAEAGRLRRRVAHESTAGAQKVIVALAAPLTLCFLPAFVLVGLLPLAVGMAGL